jgi:hypothetical protein
MLNIFLRIILLILYVNSYYIRFIEDVQVKEYILFYICILNVIGGI